MQGETGEIVLDRYRIEHTIGHGGFGRVFLARQTSLDRDVAIKASAPEHRDDLCMRERFRREAVLVAGINHPNVVTYHEFGVDHDGDMMLVMEYLRGSSLLDAIRKRVRLDFREITDFVSQAAEGLHAAHETGIVHRDVKPANLFIVDEQKSDRRLKVIDFGILRVDPDKIPGVSDLTRTNHVIGTPAYLAPEMLKGGRIGPSADQYALALVTVELATGRKVFGSDSGTDGLLHRMGGGEPDLQAAAPGIPSDARHVLEKALSANPCNRYGCITDFALAVRTSFPLDGMTEKLSETLTASTRVDRPVRDGVARWRLLMPGIAFVISIGAIAGYLAPALFSGKGDEQVIALYENPLSMITARDYYEGPIAASRRGSTAYSPEEKKTGNKRTAGKSATGAGTSSVKSAGYAELSLNARPWADVYVDGIAIGRTPLLGVTLKPGIHKVVFRHPKLGESVHTMTLKPGEKRNIAADITSGGRRDGLHGLQIRPGSNR